MAVDILYLPFSIFRLLININIINIHTIVIFFYHPSSPASSPSPAAAPLNILSQHSPLAVSPQLTTLALLERLLSLQQTSISTTRLYIHTFVLITTDIQSRAHRTSISTAMMQPAPLLFALGVFATFKVAIANELVEEHNDLTDGTGVLQVPAGLDAVDWAMSKWPKVMVTSTKTHTKTEKPTWTTLPTVTLGQVHTTTITPTTVPNIKLPTGPPFNDLSEYAEWLFSQLTAQHTPGQVARDITTIVPISTLPVGDPDSTGDFILSRWTQIMGGPFETSSPLAAHSHVKRAESSSHNADTIVVFKDTSGHRSTSTMTPTATQTHTTTITPVSILVVSGTSSDKSTGTPAPRLAVQTTAIGGQTFTIPTGIEVVSATTVKLATKTKVVHTTLTTTVPAKSAILAMVTGNITTTATVGPLDSTASSSSDPKNKFAAPSNPWPCHGSWNTRQHCIPFSKKWLWLLTIPVLLLLGLIPCCIWAGRRLFQRRRTEKEGLAPYPVQATAVTPAPMTAAAAGDAGRRAEEGRGPVPVQNASQTVTSTGPDGKVITVPAATTEHVESVPHHDGAGSFDAGSLRGRNLGRSPFMMRF